MIPVARQVTRALAITLWGGAAALAVLSVQRVARVSEAFAGMPSLVKSSADLTVSYADLHRSMAALSGPPTAVPLPQQQDAGPNPDRPPFGMVAKASNDRVRYTEDVYENELASDLAKCEPEWMARYQETVPFYVYGNPAFRRAVRHVMLSPTFNGDRWLRTANGDPACKPCVSLYEWQPTKDPTAERWSDQRAAGRAMPVLPRKGLNEDELGQARNRLVRMAAACVNLFFEGSLLAVDRYGSGLVVVRQPSRFPQPPTREVEGP